MTNPLRISAGLRTNGVTAHWHGYPVPWTADGVVGVAQDAAAPSEIFGAAFAPDRAETYLHNTHRLGADPGAQHGRSPKGWIVRARLLNTDNQPQRITGHSLQHAALRDVLHLAYCGLSTQFEPGHAAGNAPK